MKRAVCTVSHAATPNAVKSLIKQSWESPGVKLILGFFLKHFALTAKHAKFATVAKENKTNIIASFARSFRLCACLSGNYGVPTSIEKYISLMGI